MKMGVATLFALLGCAATSASASASVSVAVTSSRTPVERVVNLLEELKEKLYLDEKTEHKVYFKYACWCENTTTRKVNAIAEAEKSLWTLGQTILSLKGLINTRINEIGLLQEAIVANKEAQAQATSLREKENTAYSAQTEELKQAIAAMEKAVTVLVKGSGASAFLQESSARAALKGLMAALPVTRSVSSEKLALLGEVLSGSSKYMPQSMTVQGILKDMYETFAKDLESATLAEATANRNFENFLAEKTAQLKADESQKAKKEGEKAEAEQRLADTQAIYDETMAQKKADTKFLNETKTACQAKHEEWTTRSSLRSNETAGIAEAIKILSSDEARELFARSIKAGKEVGASDKYNAGRDISPSFVQISEVNSMGTSQAYSAISKIAKESHSFRLASLALEVRSAKVGHFEKVIKAIDGMIETLKSEDAADIAKRDQCKEEYTKIESTSKDLMWKIEKNNAKIAKLSKLIELREEQKAQTIQDIADVDAQMQALTDQRTEENTVFLKAKLDDQNAIDLLMAARKAMSTFYKENGIEMGPVQGSVKGVFAQDPEFAVSQDQAPEAVFSHKGHHQGEAKGIVSILTMIIEDLNDEIKNDMKAEESAHLQFEDLMAAAQQLRADLVSKKVSLEEAIAKRTQERSDEEDDLEANQHDLDDEIAYKQLITADCDWIIGAFEKRASARTAELNGLTGAKEFLAGQQALLETSKSGRAEPHFEDSAFAKVRFLGLRK